MEKLHIDDCFRVVDEKIENLQHLLTNLNRMEASCDVARDTIKSTADSLVSAIKEHEQRLLNEVETFRETEYKKCGARRGSLDSFLNSVVEKRDKLRLQSIQGIIDDYDIHLADKSQQECSDGIQQLKKRLESSSIEQDIQSTQQIFFNTVRCNTSFGTVDPVEASPQTPIQAKKTLRSLSVGQPTVYSALLRVKSPDLNRSRSESVSVHRKSHDHHDPNQVGCRTSIRKMSFPSMTPSSSDQGLSSLSLITQVVSEKCVWKVAREGSQLGEVNCPNDVLFLDDGSAVVSDRDNLRVQVFDNQGTAHRSLLSGEVKPRRIALTRDGHIAVTDSRSNVIKIVSLQGKVLNTWGGKKKSKINFTCPCGITVTNKGQFVISDLEKHTLTIVTRDGKSSRPFQTTSSCSEFHSPGYVTSDSNDRIYVSDSWYQTIYVFDNNGKPVFEVSKISIEQGTHLKYPNGICVDAQNNIYVAEWGNHTVTKFSSDGVFIEHVLTRSDGILHPAGIAVHRGRLAVTEYSDSHSAVGVYNLNTEDVEQDT